ncbi:MAG: C40 family peptidase [Actinomycetota bacterium]|nr:C40 family peptidase [Actinomycetota bacterium]
MSREAECRAAVAPVRAEPRGDAEQVTQILRGEPITVGERRAGWARIRTAYDYPGWIREDALGSPARSDWLRSRGSGDPVAEARSYLGAPYEWGGMTERGIDCSGLVHMAYRRTGRLVPRDADQQEEAGEPVAEADLRHGDLVTYGDTRADHVAFWLGAGKILHATGRAGVRAVVEEQEPAQLRARRRRLVRFP